MSIFHFRTLILGSDLDAIHFFISRAFGEPGEDKDTYVSLYKEIKILDNICELEIDALTTISADLDEIISTADGIIYFLNPIIQEESELFEMILPDIFSIKRDIPTIILFYDQNGILPISVNDLLTHIWVNFPSLEAFVNLAPHDFHQALQSLCLAMINSDTPLNIENAWMRFPIFIQMANIYFNNQNYLYAAQAVRKAAQIAEIYNKEEFFIICEQAAYLYSKINLYLEASKIIENVDNRKSKNFKKLYADAIIREGNLLFNRNEYERAARNYETAAHFASLEFLDKELTHEAFRSATNSWISACRVEDAFRILESLPHQEVIALLKEISDKICASADFLVKKSDFSLAKSQLYIAIDKYQRGALFDELKDLTNKLNEVLITLFKQQVNEKKNFDARSTNDEIENMWESYNVKKVNLDATLEDLINHFLEEDNFRVVTVLINKLNSSKLKQKLAKIRDEFEDRYRTLKKKEAEDYLNKGIEVIRDFVEVEKELIIEINTQKINEANEFIKQDNYLEAANHVRKHAEYLKKIGKEEIRDQILTKSLDILLEGFEFEAFFLVFNELSEIVKSNYLKRIFLKYLHKLEKIKNSDDFKRLELIFDNSISTYRKQMLYDQSKEIVLIFIKIIKNEALRILESRYFNNEKGRIDLPFSFVFKPPTPPDDLELVGEPQAKLSITEENQEYKYYCRDCGAMLLRGQTICQVCGKRVLEKELDLSAINEAEGLVKKVLSIASAYLEKEEIIKITFNKIYKKIAEIYIELDDLHSAQVYNDKIENKTYKAEIHKKIEKLEAEKSEIRSKKAKESRKGELLKERESIIENLAQGASFDRSNQMRERNGLRRGYFEEGIINLKNHQYDEAFKIYRNAVDRLNSQNMYNHAGISLAIASLILIKENKFDDINNLLVEIKTKLSGLAKSFSETFPVKLTEYILDLKTYKNEEKLKESLPLFKILPLFEEELILISDILGEDYSKGEKPELITDKLDEKRLVKLNQIFGKLESKIGEIKRDSKENLKKREVMRKRYYFNILELLNSKQFKEAAKGYIELASNFSKRKDLENSALMLFLYGLTLLKGGDPLKLIKNNINDFLNNLGIHRRLVEETFYLLLILFLIDVKLYNLSTYLPNIKKMLEFLPLFEEEKILTDID
ncbi:MAG: hypothetical protein ACFFB8_10635 [Promethearchaeota archaeon]